MRELSLDKTRIVDVEHEICPPMLMAITIPVSNDVVIYVVASAFGSKGEVITESDLLEVADRLELREE